MTGTLASAVCVLNITDVCIAGHSRALEQNVDDCFNLVNLYYSLWRRSSVWRVTSSGEVAEVLLFSVEQLCLSLP